MVEGGIKWKQNCETSLPAESRCIIRSCAETTENAAKKISSRMEAFLFFRCYNGPRDD